MADRPTAPAAQAPASRPPASSPLSRRRLMTAAAAATAWYAASGSASARLPEKDEREPGRSPAVPDTWQIERGRIRQSVMGWCFASAAARPMSVPDLIRHCRDIGLVAIEGIDASFYPQARAAGLEISLASSHGFARGPVDRDNHAFCIESLRAGIDRCVEVGCPSVITFTGMRKEGQSDRESMQNCVDCWQQVLPYAEEKGITLCLEHLNSRDDSHPMKGHPGYFGDDVELCVDLIRRVDSPRMKLLFDVYHVQIMNGDVIRRIRQYADLIGHYHTAGNPGRCELHQDQEIQYPAVMRAIVETGYEGYVAQEFIPTWEDPVAALRQAAYVCDV